MDLITFIDALNDYSGDNIWEDLIWGVNLEGDEVAGDGGDDSGCCIVLRSGTTIVYSEASKRWSSDAVIED